MLLAVGCGRLQFDGAQTETADAADDASASDAADRTDAARSIAGPGTWTATPASPVPPRLWTSAVWTGTEFIVVGGAIDAPAYNATATGARFDPATGLWRATSTTNALVSHSSLTVWSGQEVLAYGGGDQYTSRSGGARYTPTTDTWAAMSTIGQPGNRMYAANVWASDRWLIWGGWAGVHRATGAMYTPATDTWTAMTTVGAPSARSFPSGVWTGTELIVWGGCDGAMGACPGIKGDGAIYNPATDSWRAMSPIGAPSARNNHAAVWTGSELLIWAGATGPNFSPQVNDGARYDPTTDTWRAMSNVGAPSPRAAFGAAWLHDKMVIWGPTNGDGFLYDPSNDQWSRMQSTGQPSGRQRFGFAVSDRSVFVWGGIPLDGVGAVWTPQ